MKALSDREIAAGVERWTEERVATLKRMHADDATASQIATELGEGFTRNAVLGKIHRMKLPAVRAPRPLGPPKPKPARRMPAPRRAAPTTAKPSNSGQGRAFKMKRAKDAGLSLDEAMAAVLGRDLVASIGDSPDGRPLLRLDQLNEHTCKWPFGDPREASFGFCGGHALEKGPYCATHAARAYNSGAAA